jgi:signal transduction histidine kinase
MLRGGFLEKTQAEDQARFWSRALHDLRSGLRRINISADRLEMELPEPGDEKLAEPLRGLRDGVLTIDRILTALGHYAAAGSPDSYSMAGIGGEGPLRNALSALRTRIESSGAVISSTPIPRVYGDRDRLSQLFTMVLENALLYSAPAQPRIEVSAFRSGEEVTVTVKDFGQGIAANYLPRVGEPFYRLHGSDIPGVGLGLATCRRILEAHGGRLNLRSEPHEFTEVCFTLRSAE